MPLHEYVCQDCRSQFEVITSSAKADEVPCLMCNSVQTRRLISVIAGVGGRSSDPGGYQPSGGGAGCCGGAGGCACR